MNTNDTNDTNKMIMIGLAAIKMIMIWVAVIVFTGMLFVMGHLNKIEKIEKEISDNISKISVDK